jgi:hypothetical protein
MLSPHDLGMHPVHGYVDSCRASRICGRLFDAFGFASCPYAGVIGRVIGIDPYQPYPTPYGLPDICKHCHHSLCKKDKEILWEAAKKGEIKTPTPSFERGMQRGPFPIRRFQDRL